MEKQLEHYQLKDAIAAYINMYTSIFMRELHQENLDRLNELASEGLHCEHKDNDVYAIMKDGEIKLTYNKENEFLFSYFSEGLDLNETDDEVRTTIRLQYHDENDESVQEDRSLVFIFQKTGEDWLIKELYN